MHNNSKKFSVVVPIYNEEGSIEPFYPELDSVMGWIGEDYEIIFVNDGSIDGSAGVLSRLHCKERNLVVVTLSRHEGQSTIL